MVEVRSEDSDKLAKFLVRNKYLNPGFIHLIPGFVEIMEVYKSYKSCTGVCIDTRKLISGQMFFALKGPHFDANQFALKALDQGAQYAVVDDPAIAHKDERLLLVDDVLACMQDLAGLRRKEFSGPVLAITGSNGKTTTKELVVAALSTKFQVHASPGNYNNLIGLPFTILNTPSHANYLVLEMGANAGGEIREMCSIANPDFGLITNIGKAHFEGFVNLEGVKRAKSELYDSLQSDEGSCFVNLDEPHLEELSRRVSNRIFYADHQYSGPLETIVKTELIEESPTLKVAFTSSGQNFTEISTHLPGSYNYPNISSAIAIAKYFNVEEELIKKGLEAFIPKNNRSQWLQKGTNRIFLDAYNANPTSMRKSLDSFLNNSNHPKLLILGDMLEIGPDSRKEHQLLLDELQHRKKEYKALWLVGKEFSNLQPSEGVRFFANAQEVKNELNALDLQNYSIFLKGSRGIRLEEVVSD